MLSALDLVFLCKGIRSPVPLMLSRQRGFIERIPGANLQAVCRTYQMTSCLCQHVILGFLELTSPTKFPDRINLKKKMWISFRDLKTTLRREDRSGGWTTIEEFLWGLWQQTCCSRFIKVTSPSCYGVGNDAWTPGVDLIVLPSQSHPQMCHTDREKHYLHF